MGAFLFNLLTTAATLFTETAVGEMATSAGKAAFEAIKARLITQYGVKSLALLDDARSEPAYAAAIEKELTKPEIAEDAEVGRLAEVLRQAIEDLPAETQARYAIDTKTIRAGRDVLVENAEGVRADTIDAGQDATLRNVTAPPGK